MQEATKDTTKGKHKHGVRSNPAIAGSVIVTVCILKSLIGIHTISPFSIKKVFAVHSKHSNGRAMRIRPFLAYMKSIHSKSLKFSVWTFRKTYFVDSFHGVSRDSYFSSVDSFFVQDGLLVGNMLS